MPKSHRTPLRIGSRVAIACVEGKECGHMVCMPILRLRTLKVNLVGLRNLQECFAHLSLNLDPFTLLNEGEFDLA